MREPQEVKERHSDESMGSAVGPGSKWSEGKTGEHEGGAEHGRAEADYGSIEPEQGEEAGTTPTARDIEKPHDAPPQGAEDTDVEARDGDDVEGTGTLKGLGDVVGDRFAGTEEHAAEEESLVLKVVGGGDCGRCSSTKVIEGTSEAQGRCEGRRRPEQSAAAGSETVGDTLACEVGSEVELAGISGFRDA